MKDKLYLPRHHSITDWDFEHGAQNCSLVTSQYISAPTSLAINMAGAESFFGAILCRLPSTLCLPQGEVRTWVRHHYPDTRIALFRNQAPLGSANLDNTYLIYLVGTYSYLYRYIDAYGFLIDQGTCQTFVDTWTHYRVVFVNGETPEVEPALCVTLYREVAGEWIQEGETMYDTANQWKDSEINRVGFHAEARVCYPNFWDDTEIWGPVAGKASVSLAGKLVAAHFI